MWWEEWEEEWEWAWGAEEGCDSGRELEGAVEELEGGGWGKGGGFKEYWEERDYFKCFYNFGYVGMAIYNCVAMPTNFII